MSNQFVIPWELCYVPADLMGYGPYHMGMTLLLLFPTSFFSVAGRFVFWMRLAAGTYVFSPRADDQIHVYVGDRRSRKSTGDVFTIIQESAGFLRMEVQFMEFTGWAYYGLRWDGGLGGSKYSEIPGSLIYGRQPGTLAAVVVTVNGMASSEGCSGAADLTLGATANGPLM
jgi:hypothetical protein